MIDLTPSSGHMSNTFGRETTEQNAESPNNLPCETDDHEKPSVKTMKLWPQVLVAFTASIAHLSLGTILGYPAISVPELSTPPPDPFLASLEYEFTNKTQSPDESRHPCTSVCLDLNDTLPQTANSSAWDGFLPRVYLSNSQIGWFVSIQNIGAIAGSLICGPLVNGFGQRKTVIFTCPFILISWLLIWAAPMPSVLMVSRVLAGICTGISITAAQVYVVETAHESVRGFFGCATDCFVGIGQLFTYALGVTSLGWRWSAFTLGLVTTLPLTVGLCIFPDSPRWLITKGRRKSAEKALKFLRGNNHDFSAELDHIIKVGINSSQNTLWQHILNLKRAEVHTPFLIICGMLVLMQFSGLYVIYSYTVLIFQAAEVSLSPYLSAVLVGVARVIGSGIGLMVVDRAGRRPAMIVGGIGTALSLACLAIYFSLMRPNGASSLSGWLAIGSMMLYTLFVGATVSPISFLLSTELLPLTFRSLGSATSKIFFFLAGMITTASFSTLIEGVGLGALFGFYAASAVVLVFLALWMLPETKGRSLEEIEEYYKERALHNTD